MRIYLHKKSLCGFAHNMQTFATFTCIHNTHMRKTHIMRKTYLRDQRISALSLQTIELYHILLVFLC